MNITTVVFDCGEVVFTGFRGMNEVLNREFGCELQGKDLDTPEMLAYYRGELSEDVYWRSQIERFGWKTTAERLKTLVRENFKEVPGTRALITEVRSRGFRTGVLSIHGREWVSHLDQRYRFNWLFDRLFYSYATGKLKPDPAAFMEVAEAFGIAPEECLYVDDYEINTKAAKSLGFETHLFTSADRLRDELRERKVLR